MVDNVLFHDFLLIVLLWLGGILYKGWARNQSATCPTIRKPATPLQQRSRGPKPFPGPPTDPAVLLVSRPRSLALQPSLSHPRCFPLHRDGRARWIPLSSSVPSRAVPIMVGWGWAIFGPMVIPAVVSGVSSSVSAARNTFWRPMGHRCIASAWRLRYWCGRWVRWPKG